MPYLDTMLDSRSVRRSAKQVEVAITTSFRWRHRFLRLAKDDRPAQLTGIAEADEMYVLESHKGSRKLTRPPRKRGGKATKRGISNEQMCIVVARDRVGGTIDAVTGKGALTIKQLIQHLGGRLARDVLLVTDSHAAYPAFAREIGISHAAVLARAGGRTRGALHIQNVNAYHSRVRSWLLPFLRRRQSLPGSLLRLALGDRWTTHRQSAAFLRAALGFFNS